MASPTANSVPVRSVSYSGSYWTDGLIVGAKWGAGAPGTAVRLTYSFPGLNSYWDPSYSAAQEPFTTFTRALSSTERSAVQSALAKWAAVAGVSFALSSDTSATVGELRFAWQDGGNEQAYAYLPDNSAAAGDVWLNANADWSTGYAAGSYEYLTILHEIGHAIGLDHPFEGPRILDVADDHLGSTVMTYSAYPGRTGSFVDYNPTTPMWADIAAAQYLYGANTRFNASSTVYNFYQGRDYHQTIWDGGGTDTINWNASSEAATIDLRAGRWSDLGNSLSFYDFDGTFIADERFNVIIYDGVVIERAYGGSGNDYIYGNSANNTLLGRSGADYISASTGNDVINGGANGTGRDRLYGSSGIDRFDFNSIAESPIGAQRDYIGDFVHGTDELDLVSIDANTSASGNQAFKFVGTKGLTAAGQVHLQWVNPAGTTNDRTIVSGDVNGDRIADFEIEMKGIVRLDAGDFIL